MLVEAVLHEHISMVLARSLGVMASNAAQPVKNLIMQNAG